MQLPRGRFRSVIRGVALNSLIQELAEVRYTGHVAVSWKKEAVSLVIQKGRYILAEHGPLKGDRAWEVTTALGETTVDAVLSDFSDPELKLALEFNAPCLLSSQTVAKGLRTPREKQREPSPFTPQGKAGEPSHPARVPDLPATTPPVLPEEAATGEGGQEPAPPEPQRAWTQVDMGQAIAVASDQGGAGSSPEQGYDELALLHMEMSALDDVDVEHIATKIRKNARGIVKKLHLGHLMTEKED